MSEIDASGTKRIPLLTTSKVCLITAATQGVAAVTIAKDWTVRLHGKEVEMSDECRQVIYEVSKCYQPNTPLKPPRERGDG